MYNTLIFAPLYNFLVWLVDLLPMHQMWIAVTILTIVVKIILIPLYKKQIKDQVILAHITPKMKAVQEKYKDKKEDLSREMLAIYKEYKVNPFTTIFLLIIQFPILIALYNMFLKPIDSHKDILYSFVQFPESINNFLFSIDLSSRSLIIVVLAVLSQYLANMYMMSKKPDASAGEFAQSMHVQMKYLMPVIIGFVSYVTPAVISVYIIAGNIFAVFQEIVIRRPLEKSVKAGLK
jgi:YidC/Oxa1 family membrane protein insertase